jgi:solute carrier family 25 (mitochondrial S-adenosylmethionine transporter), member 26
MVAGDWQDIGRASPKLAAEAAAGASVLAKLFLYPIDTLKCRRQAGLHPQSIYQLRGLYAGVLPKLALYGPYQALYMYTYTSARERLHPSYGVWAFPISGVVADLAGTVVRLPMEVIKQRMQAGVYSSSVEAVKRIATCPRAQLLQQRLFIAQTLFHDIPYGLVQWTTYELLTRSEALSFFPKHAVHVAVGMSAGALAAFVTTPLDVVKTRIVTRSSEYTGISQAVKKILVEDGARAFTRGWFFRVMHIAPGTGIYFGLFHLLYQFGAST